VEQIRTIVVHRAGLLGDTLVSLPALWCLRNAYPRAKIVYLWQKTHHRAHVSAASVIKGSNLVDEFMCDHLFASHILTNLFRLLLLVRLRRKKIDLAIVLEAPYWNSKKRARYLKLCGAKVVVAPAAPLGRLPKQKNGHLLRVAHIADQLMEGLRPLGIDIPSERSGKMFLPVKENVKRRVSNWCEAHKLPHASRVVVGAWSNMPAKRWPLENYRSVLDALVKEFEIYPIILGGREDRSAAEWLVEECGRGIVAAGQLSVQEGVCLASTARLYLGNDTGVMHMAAAAGVPCVAIFASTDSPGLWEPYGFNHVVLRTPIECEGCLLRECIANEMRCIRGISPEQVLQACRQYL
jgi:heptosyltransferase III